MIQNHDPYFILPHELEDSTQIEVLEFLLKHRQERPTIFCTGYGGGTSPAVGIISAIRSHGNVIGVLNGKALSSNAMVFMACQTRVVMPFGSLGFHGISWASGEDYASVTDLYHVHKNFSDLQAAYIQMCVEHSTIPTEEWYEMFSKYGILTYREIGYHELIERKIAIAY